METIYLNQAGTSWPKPMCVQTAVLSSLDTDPLGRAGEAAWAGSFDASLAAIAGSLGISDSSRLLLTPGCTSALALAVESHIWQTGSRIITSGLEHHALHRPLLQLQRLGVQVDVIPPSGNSPIDLDQVEESLRRGRVSLVAMTAASNVTGDIFPIEQVTKLAKRYGAMTLVDGAQTVGWLDYDLAHSDIDLFAFGGHKGLQGIWGIGGLYVAPNVVLQTYNASCELPNQQQDKGGDNTAPNCVPMPSYCDGGSVDRCALAGLGAAIDWLLQPREPEANPKRNESSRQAVQLPTQTENRLSMARSLIARLRQGLENIPEIDFYGFGSLQQRLPTLAFNRRGVPSSRLARQLADHGIAIGSGLQCAPLAHEHLGTAGQGVARISVGPMNSLLQMERALTIIEEVIDALA